jgi:hypothetical protein
MGVIVLLHAPPTPPDGVEKSPLVALSSPIIGLHNLLPPICHCLLLYSRFLHSSVTVYRSLIEWNPRSYIVVHNTYLLLGLPATGIC